MTKTEKLIRALCDPSLLVRQVWKKFPIGSFELRQKFDAYERPQYAFGIYHAAKLAKRLGMDRVSVIEFGVFNGNGLSQMQVIAKEAEAFFGVEIDLYGFDGGSMGLPKPIDYRDHPYIWSEGELKMDDQKKLQEKLPGAKLIIGNVKDTIDTFFAKYNPAPIGFMVFDLDLYSSTMDAFKVFKGDEKYFLPRVFCYFDDVVDMDVNDIYHEFAGELLAIKEFNEANKNKKIAAIGGLTQRRYFRSWWPEAMRVAHLFDHKLYNKHTH